jgi:hypothetical protein
MTKQIRDLLEYEGETYSLNTYILDSYEKDVKKTFSGTTTALYRGYVATFCIKDDYLYIKDLRSFYQATGGFMSILKDNFPDSKRCNWFSGLLRIDKTKGYFDDEKEDYTFEYLEIYKGHFIGKRTMDYYELQRFKVTQFQHFKKTEAYQKMFNNLQNAYDDAYKADTIILKRILRLITEVV